MLTTTAASKKKSELENVIVDNGLPNKHLHCQMGGHKLDEGMAGWIREVETKSPAILFSGRDYQSPKVQLSEITAAKQCRVQPNGKLLVRGMSLQAFLSLKSLSSLPCKVTFRR